jgi:dimethylhistidine N-methyltransferase
MSVSTSIHLSEFAFAVAKGLGDPTQKKIPPRYFYDDLGSALFEAITLLPEYGLTRADERVLRRFAAELPGLGTPVSSVAELGSGSGRKTEMILRALADMNPHLTYSPIDVSQAALNICKSELSGICRIEPVCADWSDGLKYVSQHREVNSPLLLLFLGSSIGNIDREEIDEFLTGLRSSLRSGDLMLIGADLVKERELMLAAYDDPTGVTAAFNLNLLGRMNRELDAQFDLRSFAHEVRWNQDARRIEMHLLSCRHQTVPVGALDASFEFQAGETIWTESSHKFTIEEFADFARASGFTQLANWVDDSWPFAEVLWEVD